MDKVIPENIFDEDKLFIVDIPFFVQDSAETREKIASSITELLKSRGIDHKIHSEDIGEIYPAVLNRHGKKRVHQTKHTAEINLQGNKAAKKAILDHGYLDVKFERAHFKKITHPNEFLNETWQKIVNTTFIEDVDPEQLKSKDALDKEYFGLTADEIKKIQDEKKRARLQDVQKQHRDQDAQRQRIAADIQDYPYHIHFSDYIVDRKYQQEFFKTKSHNLRLESVPLEWSDADLIRFVKRIHEEHKLDKESLFSVKLQNQIFYPVDIVYRQKKTKL